MTVDYDKNLSIASIKLSNPYLNYYDRGEFSINDKKILMGMSEIGITSFDGESLRTVEPFDMAGANFFRRLPDSQGYLTLIDGNMLTRSGNSNILVVSSGLLGERQ